jgi:hypothetical protein
MGDAAVRAFTALPSRQRAKLLRLFDHLARFPHHTGDYQESGASGRIFEIKLVDDLLITWWNDPAEREVRIVRIEIVH